MKPIFIRLINSLLAGTLVFLGALSDGEITTKGVYIASIASGIVAITQFKDYFNKIPISKKKNIVKIFNFIKV